MTVLTLLEIDSLAESGCLENDCYIKGYKPLGGLRFYAANNKDQSAGYSYKYIKINKLFKIRVRLILLNQVTPSNIRRLRDKIKLKKT